MRAAGRGRPSPRGSPARPSTCVEQRGRPRRRAWRRRRASRRRARGPRRAPSVKSAVRLSGLPSSIERAAFLALSTSGWSNGLIPSSRPAVAVATSHSSICAPRVPVTDDVGARRAGAASSGSTSVGRGVVGEARRPSRRAAAARPRGRSRRRPRPGSSPVPCLPVLSAISCSAQSAKPTSRSPGRRARACRAAGWCRRSRRRAGARGWPRRRRPAGPRPPRPRRAARPMSAPASPLGTRPNAVSARVAAADVGVGVDDRGSRRRGDCWSSGLPGSVTTTMRCGGVDAGVA